MLSWAVTHDAPRVHYATSGPWVFVVRALGTRAFRAYYQRLGWEKSDDGYFTSLADAKAWLQQQATDSKGDGR